MKIRGDMISDVLNNQEDRIVKALKGIPPTAQITVSQGYGIGAKLPLRCLAYGIGVSRLAEQLPSQTKIDLYIALEGVLRANPGIDEKRVRENSALLKELLKSFFPKPNFRVMLDRPITPGGRIERLITEQLRPALHDICLEHDSIRHFIENRGGQSAADYVAAHQIYMRDNTRFEWTDSKPGYPSLVPEMSFEMEHLIMVGGPSERIFWLARRELARRLGEHDSWQSHQFFTPIGDPPTYHWQKGEAEWKDRARLSDDVSLALIEATRNVTMDHKKRNGVVRDLLVLVGHLGGVKSWNLMPKKLNDKPVNLQLSEQVRRILNHEHLSPEISPVLQKGWDKLRSI